MAFASGPFEQHLISRGRVDGVGKFSFTENEPVYHGSIVDGRFHGEGHLLFKDGTKYIATWSMGKPQNARVIFGDGLEYEKDNWAYCQENDRRYQSEIVGLSPAGKQLQEDQKTVASTKQDNDDQ